jgi:hypothetical protein
MIDTRWRSSITNAKTVPGADCGSDHVLLVAWLTMRLKAPRKRPLRATRQPSPTELSAIAQTVERRLQEAPPPTCVDANALLEHLRNTITDAAASLPKSENRPTPKKCWISDDSWRLIKQRKDIKSFGLKNDNARDTYRKLSKQIQAACRRDKNAYINNICTDIEKHALKLQTADLFKKVRILCREFKPRS